MDRHDEEAGRIVEGVRRECPSAFDPEWPTARLRSAIASALREKASRDAALMTHWWCDNCGAIRMADIAPPNMASVDGGFMGGDVVCRDCRFVIATHYRVAALAAKEGGKHE